MEFTSSSFVEATKKEDYSIDVDEFSLIKNICISDAAVGNIIFQVLYTSFPIHNRTPYVMEFYRSAFTSGKKVLHSPIWALLFKYFINLREKSMMEVLFVNSFQSS